MLKRVIKRTVACGLVFLIIAFLGGCPNASLSKRSAQINGFGWVLENIDTSFWTSPSTATAFFNIQIKFDDQDLVSSDFQEITYTSPDGKVWTIDQADIDRYFNPTTSVLSGYDRKFSSSWDNGHYVQIGNYDVEVILTNGSSDTDTVYIPAPGSTSTNGDTVAYTEDSSSAGSPPGDYTPLPLRANITAASRTGTSVTVTFDVNDSLIYSGYLWFYDSSDNYVGTSVNDFRDYSSGVVDGTVNGGFLNTNGTNNVVTYNTSDISFVTGKSIADIAEVHVVLTDGQQYHLASYSFDSRSISEVFPVTVL